MTPLIPVFHDYETKSGKNITKHGRVNHLRDPYADIVFLSYKVGAQKTKLWWPGQPVPRCFINTERYHYYAFNAQFDWAVTNVLGIRHGFTKQKLSQITDLMAVCGRYSYPQKLEKALKALGLKGKDRRGNALMKKICGPLFKATRAEMAAFGQYCITDTDRLYQMSRRLPSIELSDEERARWELIVKINLRGLPVDTPAATRINQVVNFTLNKRMKEVPRLTDGAVQTINQGKKILAYCAEYGVEMPNFQKATVAAQLECDDTPPEVEAVLRLRQELGGSAIKKYQKLLDLAYKRVLYDNLRYWGAGPGRLSGMGFQPQNLPRAEVLDPEAEIQKFYNSLIMKEQPLASAKALVRSMIKAPDGKVLIAADYKSIEYIIAMWWVGDTDRVKSFAAGICPYKKGAADRLGKDYKDITKQERTEEKPIQLGAQYYMGWKALIEYGKNFGVDISPALAKYSINFYREGHPLIVEAWDELKEATLLAVHFPGKAFTYKQVTFKVLTDRSGTPWLRMTLPSKRHIFYCRPQIKNGKFGDVVEHWGMNPVNKQWCLKEFPPNRIIENVIQGLGWDAMIFGMQNVDPIYPVIGSVHDEVIVLANKDEADLTTMIDLICAKPMWAGGLPLMADGWVGPRYKKD